MLRFFNKRLHNRKGFTLIELIVVIAILAILALIAIPRLAGFTESARQANDEELAAVVANAGAMYAASHQETAIGTLADEIEGITALSTSGLIEKVYAAADLTSTKYSGITVNYVEDATEAAAAGEPVGTTIVTLEGGTGATDDYVVSK